jgi:galactokinase
VSATLVDGFARTFGPGDCRLFEAPGRVELGGNHTDHHGGRVLAAATRRRTRAAAAPSGRDEIRVVSEELAEHPVVRLDDLEPRPEDRGRPAALVRGVAADLVKLGIGVAGFDAFVAGDLPIGAGLSSSASFAVLMATLMDHLFGGGRLGEVARARAAWEAERSHFGKPCGLMDQIASATGGIVAIDFADPEEPAVRRLDFDLGRHGFDLLVVDTGSSHADLAAEYASIPDEMSRLAAALGRERCRDLSREEILAELPRLRREVGDRAILRGLHFLAENERVDEQVAALEAGDVERFLARVRESGDSSWKLLQNCYPAAAVREQGIPLALALSEEFLGEGPGACRLLGGGFAGAIQVLLPRERTAAYRERIEGVFGEGAAMDVELSNAGAREIPA